MLKISEIFPSIQGEGWRIGCLSLFVRTQGCSLNCVHCDSKYSWAKEVEDSAGKWTGVDLASRVIDQASKHNCTDLVLTGGEPFEQSDKSLYTFLNEVRSFFQHITIETAAFVPISKINFVHEIFREIDTLSVSPKLPAFWKNQKIDVKLDNYYRTVADYCKLWLGIRGSKPLSLKFVITDVEELKDVKGFLSTVYPPYLSAVKLILQPNGYTQNTHGDYVSANRDVMIDNLRSLTEAVRDGEGWRRLQRSGMEIRILPQLHRLLYGDARGV